MKVYLNQILNQEIQARCAALFSRSHESFDEQLKKATKEKASQFAKTYVSGYGHNSINDCGNICASIERVSMIAAKFIEDFPLFNGQESSTRYIPFDIGTFEENVISPYDDTDERKNIQKGLMNFYRRALPIQQKYVASVNNVDLDNCDPITKNAIKAKSFDILRGYLPAGCKTQLAMITTLRQAIDRIEIMLRHPLDEIKSIGIKLQNELIEMYPGAAHGLLKDSHIAEAYKFYNNDYWDKYYTILAPYNEYFSVSKPEESYFTKTKLYKSRHQSKKLPPIYDIVNDTCEIDFHIDYGSWRDIHRHRNCYQTSSLLSSHYFENFYFENLAPELKPDAKYFIEQSSMISHLFPHDRFLNQYAIPMGFKVRYRAKWSFSQLIYVLELRSKSTVHHTLRTIIKKIYDETKYIHELDIPFDNFDNPLSIDQKRGAQI